MKSYTLLFIFFISILSLQAQKQQTIYVGIGSNIGKSAEFKNLSSDLSNYLSSKLNASVYIVIPERTTQLIEAIKEDKIDIALLNTFGYVLAAEKASIEPLLVISDKQTPVAYQSCILAHPSTLIKTSEDLRAQASNYSFTFVNSSSTSGHLVPRLYLNSINLQPEYFFKDIAFGDSHYQTILNIKQGNSKVGACSYTDLNKWIKEGKFSQNDFNIIWTSQPIINGPVAVRKELSSEQKQRIKMAFINMKMDNPELHQKLIKIWHNIDADNTYTDAKDDLYNSIRQMADSMEELSIIIGLYSE